MFRSEYPIDAWFEAAGTAMTPEAATTAGTATNTVPTTDIASGIASDIASAATAAGVVATTAAAADSTDSAEYEYGFIGRIIFMLPRFKPTEIAQTNAASDIASDAMTDPTPATAAAADPAGKEAASSPPSTPPRPSIVLECPGAPKRRKIYDGNDER